MQTLLKYGLKILFLLLALLGASAIYSIVQSQAYGRLINYVGIVRGASQRLIKLEISGRPSDGLIVYLNGILHELQSGQGSYGLITPDDQEYAKNLSQLSRLWETIKTDIRAARENPAAVASLLGSSEDFFELANKTVFAAEAYANRQTSLLLRLIMVMTTFLLLTWLFILWAYGKKMLLLENMTKNLSDMTDRDSLTGALNLERFKREARKLISADANVRYAIAYVDFADFKYINDVFGYEYGNAILKEYARIAGNELKDNELLGRVSADNFVILRSYEEKMEVLARQRAVDDLITDFMHRSQNKQTLPVCCGICCLEDAPGDLVIENLLDRANFARKTVKNGEHANYAFYNESIRDELLEEKTIASQMEEALSGREFLIYYQPKVDAQSGAIACSEALVRWKRPDGQIIPPDKFIPIFEKNHLIAALDQYVFENVCRSLRRRLDAGQPVLPVSVNISRLQFYETDFVATYAAIKNRYQIPNGLLELEFTESIAFDNLTLLTKIVKELKRENFSCSIDDFGKGYSSLSLLKDLPIDTLKIDRLFFVHGENKAKDAILVESIVELVRKLNIRTVAEGIETTEQVAFLQSIRCDLIQGYVFFRPMPEQEYEAALEREKCASRAEFFHDPDRVSPAPGNAAAQVPPVSFPCSAPPTDKPKESI